MTGCLCGLLSPVTVRTSREKRTMIYSALSFRNRGKIPDTKSMLTKCRQNCMEVRICKRVLGVEKMEELWDQVMQRCSCGCWRARRDSWKLSDAKTTREGRESCHGGNKADLAKLTSWRGRAPEWPCLSAVPMFQGIISSVSLFQNCSLCSQKWLGFHVDTLKAHGTVQQPESHVLNSVTFSGIFFFWW